MIYFDMDSLYDIDLDDLDEPKHINAFYIWFEELNFPFHGVPTIEIIENYLLWLQEKDFTRYHILELLRAIKKDYKNIAVSLMNIDPQNFLDNKKAIKGREQEQAPGSNILAISLTHHYPTRDLLRKALRQFDNPTITLSEFRNKYVKQIVDLILKFINLLIEYLNNEIECYKDVEEEVTFKTNEALLKSNKSLSNNMGVISRELEEHIKSINLKREATEFVNGVIETEESDIIDNPKFNFKKEVTEFANRMIETKELDINDTHFPSNAKNKLVADLRRRGVKLSAANKDSIRTYLSKFKSSYIQEKKKGKRKKK